MKDLDKCFIVREDDEGIIVSFKMSYTYKFIGLVNDEIKEKIVYDLKKRIKHELYGEIIEDLIKISRDISRETYSEIVKLVDKIENL